MVKSRVEPRGKLIPANKKAAIFSYKSSHSALAITSRSDFSKSSEARPGGHARGKSASASVAWRRRWLRTVSNLTSGEYNFSRLAAARRQLRGRTVYGLKPLQLEIKFFRFQTVTSGRRVLPTPRLNLPGATIKADLFGFIDDASTRRQ